VADIGAATTPAERSRVMRDSVALGLAVGAFGISFGALAVTAGLSVWQAQALSLLMFTARAGPGRRSGRVRGAQP